MVLCAASRALFASSYFFATSSYCRLSSRYLSSRDLYLILSRQYKTIATTARRVGKMNHTEKLFPAF
jgi:hypothetical protein